ncbi:MAG: biotin--[acetyl-CoA-carboxylase] ligase [Thermoplasmata archaeon]|nr:biotin--[acetyl-CoA-carboxylase] ligase [Thermoplasmata archaeon]
MAVRVAFDELDSTQTEAVRRARDGAEPGTYVIARLQRAGHGRLDHAWSSPPGGLYLSWIGRPPDAAPGLVPMAVGVELRARVLEHAGVRTVLKWPNDLLVPGASGPRKLAGILVDRVEIPNGGSRVVVGVGVNVSMERSSLPLDLAERSAILSELSESPPTVPTVARWVVESIESAFDKLNAPGGPASIVAESRQHLYGVGEPVQIDGRPAGILRDLADDGAAEVENEGTRVAVHAGDLTVGVPA